MTESDVGVSAGMEELGGNIRALNSRLHLARYNRVAIGGDLKCNFGEIECEERSVWYIPHISTHLIVVL